MFAAALGWNIADGALQNLQQRLLHASPETSRVMETVFRFARDL